MYRGDVNLKNADNYVNLSWIAHRWGVALSTVTKSHVGPGKLPVRRHGRELLVSLDDLSRYEARLRAALRERRAETVDKIDAFLGAINKPLLPVIGD